MVPVPRNLRMLLRKHIDRYSAFCVAGLISFLACAFGLLRESDRAVSTESVAGLWECGVDDSFEARNLHENTREFWLFGCGLCVAGLSGSAAFHFSASMEKVRRLALDMVVVHISLIALCASLYLGTTRTYCYRSNFGDASSTIHLFVPIHWAFGICVLPSVCSSVGRFAGNGVKPVMKCAIVASLQLLLCALFVVFNHDKVAFSVIVAACGIVLLVYTKYATAMISASETNDHDELNWNNLVRRGFTILLPVGSLTFDLLSILAITDVISDQFEQVARLVLQVIAYIIVLQIFSTQQNSAGSVLEKQLRNSEHGAQLEHASNDAKRRFMRYTFHELRVPLNAMVLGSDEATEVLGEMMAASRIDQSELPVADNEGHRTWSGAWPSTYAGRHTDPGSGLSNTGGASGLHTAHSVAAGSSQDVGVPGSMLPRASTVDAADIPVIATPSHPLGAAELVESQLQSPLPPAKRTSKLDPLVNRPAFAQDGPSSGGYGIHAPVATITTTQHAYPVVTVARASVADSQLDTLKDVIELVRDNATAMGKLLDDFLSLEKIEEGKFEVEMLPLVVREVAKEAARLFVAPLAAKQLNLKLDIEPAVPHTIVGDANKLRQVVCNYISNAIKFSPEGGSITVRVSAVREAVSAGVSASTDVQGSATSVAAPVTAPSRPANRVWQTTRTFRRAFSRNRMSSARVAAASVSPSSAPSPQSRLHPPVPKDFVRFEVIDQGVGISKEDQAKLFQPFNQIKAGALQKGNGTGLGLSICKRIIELSGGVVGVCSEEGKGSTFYFQVPVDRVASPTATGHHAPHAGNTGPAGSAMSVIDIGQPHHAPTVATLIGGGGGPAHQLPNGVESAPAATFIDVDPPGTRVSSSTVPTAQAHMLHDVPAGHHELASRSPSEAGSIASTTGYAIHNQWQHLHQGRSGTGSQQRAIGFGLPAIEASPLPPPQHGDPFTTAVSRSAKTARATRESAGNPLSLVTSGSASSAVSGPSDIDAYGGAAGGSFSPFSAEASASSSVSINGGALLGVQTLTTAVVVDDVKSNRELFGRMLQRRGVSTIHYAEDGVHAAELLDTLTPEQVSAIQVWFLDKEMPTCDGHDCAAKLRSRGVAVPIIGVTGNALDEDRRLFVAAGADTVVTKPVRVPDVEAALRQFGLAFDPRIPARADTRNGIGSSSYGNGLTVSNLASPSSSSLMSAPTSPTLSRAESVLSAKAAEGPSVLAAGETTIGTTTTPTRIPPAQQHASSWQ